MQRNIDATLFYNECTCHPSCIVSCQVTILNPKFMTLQNEWTTQGIFGELSQSVFANIRDAMTAADAFPRTVSLVGAIYLHMPTCWCYDKYIPHDFRSRLSFYQKPSRTYGFTDWQCMHHRH